MHWLCDGGHQQEEEGRREGVRDGPRPVAASQAGGPSWVLVCSESSNSAHRMLLCRSRAPHRPAPSPSAATLEYAPRCASVPSLTHGADATSFVRLLFPRSCWPWLPCSSASRRRICSCRQPNPWYARAASASGSGLLLRFKCSPLAASFVGVQVRMCRNKRALQFVMLANIATMANSRPVRVRAAAASGTLASLRVVSALLPALSSASF